MRLFAPGLALVFAVSTLIIAGCGGAVAPSSTPTATPTPTEDAAAVAAAAAQYTPQPSAPNRELLPATPTETPSPTPTPKPIETPVPAVLVSNVSAGQGIIVGGGGASYSRPTTASTVLRRLPDYTTVNILGGVVGQNWIVGNQDWGIVQPDWANIWYQLDDGSYVYSAFVFRPQGEYSAFQARQSANRYVLVDTSQQLAWAVVDGQAVYQMRVTTGKPGYDTPTGQFNVFARVQNERMTSSQAGITDPAERYDVERVLFTQYFADGGVALHLNYWRPYSAFGGYPTSHGCVGLMLHDAQYLWIFADAGTPVVVKA